MKEQSMIKAVLFDMDGTLIDTEMLYAKALKDVLENINLPLSLEEVILIVYGRSWQGIFETIEKRFPDKFESEDQLQNLATIVFNRLIQNNQLIIEGSLALLKKLAKELPIAIVSGSSRGHLHEFIEFMNIQDLIPFYIGSEDCAKSKPSPEGYLKAAKKLKIPPENCLVFEDSNPGVLAAKAAGMRCVALSRETAPKQDVSAADLILNNLSKFSLIEFLKITEKT